MCKSHDNKLLCFALEINSAIKTFLKFRTYLWCTSNTRMHNDGIFMFSKKTK